MVAAQLITVSQGIEDILTLTILFSRGSPQAMGIGQGQQTHWFHCRPATVADNHGAGEKGRRLPDIAHGSEEAAEIDRDQLPGVGVFAPG